jgi:hypothetical protein
MVAPEVLVDITRLPLRGITDAVDAISVGALTHLSPGPAVNPVTGHHRVARNPLLHRHSTACVALMRCLERSSHRGGQGFESSHVVKLSDSRRSGATVPLSSTTVKDPHCALLTCWRRPDLRVAQSACRGKASDMTMKRPGATATDRPRQLLARSSAGP